jgi:cutinase
VPVSRATAAVVAALAILSACSSGPNAAPPEPTRTPAPAHARLVADKCADLIVLGARGQAQSARTAGGVGPEVQSTTWALVEQLRGGERVRLDAIRYPARLSANQAAFDHDVEAGSRLLVARHAALASACPHSRFVVIGYSEGADVVHRAVVSMSAKDTADLAVVAVLGDPLRDPKDDVPTELYGSGHLNGRGSITGGPRWGQDVRDRVISFCTRKDNVCNAPLAGRRGGVSTAHQRFYEMRSSARVTADRMVRVIGTH